jgi:hypothetical protein
MGAVDKYDHKWKHLLNGIGFCSSLPPTPNQVFEKHLVSYNVLRGTQNAITRKKSDSKALHGWWKDVRQQGKQFLEGGAAKSKTTICRKYSIYILQAYSAVFHLKCKMAFYLECTNFSISQGVYNIHPMLTDHGVPDSFQLSTAKDPNNYGVPEDGVPDSILLASGTGPLNPPNDGTDKSDNSDPFHCDIMPSSSNEDESASIKYLKRHPALSLRSWEGVSFYNTERTLKNACIRTENFYRGNKKMHIQIRRCTSTNKGTISTNW